MPHGGLEWALRLRAELAQRIEDLRAALADMEPLRQEQQRLEAQLKGVERLIEVYHAQLGFPKPAWAREVMAEALQSSEIALAQPAAAPVPAADVSHVASHDEKASALAAANRRIAWALSSSREMAARAALSTKLWLARTFPRRNAQR